MNIFTALNIFYREDVISDFLKNCFDDSPAFLQQFLQGEWPLKDATLSKIFRDFQQALATFYAPLENPQQALSNHIKLDQTQTKICWQAVLFEQFRNQSQLWLDWGNVGGSGRNNFLFLISKPTWWANGHFEQTGLAKTYYIHIDTYINLLTDESQYVREIGVRYETHPYKPKKQIEHKEGYEEFRRNKDLFAQKLFDKVQQSELNAKKTGYDLLVLTVPIVANSLQQSIDIYANTVKQLEKIIDEVVMEIGL